MIYISFVGESGFKGACIIDADDPISALEKAKQLGCNPGGQAAFCEIDPPDPQYLDIAKLWQGKLLDRTELEMLFGATQTISELNDSGQLQDGDIGIACSCCNSKHAT